MYIQSAVEFLGKIAKILHAQHEACVVYSGYCIFPAFVLFLYNVLNIVLSIAKHKLRKRI